MSDSYQIQTFRLSQSSSLKPKILPKKLRISTHVMDTTKGVPVNGLQVSLYKLVDGRWTFMNERYTIVLADRY